MPHYLEHAQIWIDLWPIVTTAIVIAAVVAGGLRILGTPVGHSIVPLLAISLLGFVVGDLTGQSREPAIAEVIGGVLTLVGGILVYLIGTHGAEKQRVTAGATCVLAIGLLLGANWGSDLRQQFDDYRASPAFRLKSEAEEQYYRTILDLPAKPAEASPADPANKPAGK